MDSPQDEGCPPDFFLLPNASRISPVLQSGRGVDWVGIMRALRATVKAALAFHRWFMKYSGTTMIIDNIEERRRRRQSEEHSEADSGAADERDSPSQK